MDQVGAVSRVRRASIFLLLALTFPVGVVGAQDSIRVAVEIADEETGGVFQSVFASAFRRLGDVVVVSRAERPDYVLAGVVLCLAESCSGAESYAVALRLYQPANSSLARFIVDLVVDVVGAHPSRSTIDSLYTTAREMHADYEVTHMTWALRWGWARVEQGAQELVSEIDTQCLEKTRAAHRIRRDTPFRSDTPKERMERYQAYLAGRVWIC